MIILIIRIICSAILALMGLYDWIKNENPRDRNYGGSVGDFSVCIFKLKGELT